MPGVRVLGRRKKFIETTSGADSQADAVLPADTAASCNATPSIASVRRLHKARVAVRGSDTIEPNLQRYAYDLYCPVDGGPPRLRV
jgi:hypothetical protein